MCVRERGTKCQSKCRNGKTRRAHGGDREGETEVKDSRKLPPARHRVCASEGRDALHAGGKTSDGTRRGSRDQIRNRGCCCYTAVAQGSSISIETPLKQTKSYVSINGFSCTLENKQQNQNVTHVKVVLTNLASNSSVVFSITYHIAVLKN